MNFLLSLRYNFSKVHNFGVPNLGSEMQLLSTAPVVSNSSKLRLKKYIKNVPICTIDFAKRNPTLSYSLKIQLWKLSFHPIPHVTLSLLGVELGGSKDLHFWNVIMRRNGRKSLEPPSSTSEIDRGYNTYVLMKYFWTFLFITSIIFWNLVEAYLYLPQEWRLWTPKIRRCDVISSIENFNWFQEK